VLERKEGCGPAKKKKKKKKKRKGVRVNNGLPMNKSRMRARLTKRPSRPPTHPSPRVREERRFRP